jgi:hypothetical protein
LFVKKTIQKYFEKKKIQKNSKISTVNPLEAVLKNSPPQIRMRDGIFINCWFHVMLLGPFFIIYENVARKNVCIKS